MQYGTTQARRAWVLGRKGRAGTSPAANRVQRAGMDPGLRPGLGSRITSGGIMESMDYPPTQHHPLYVDLDGTLIRSDMLGESVFAMLRRRPWAVLYLPRWLMRGKAHLKQQLAERAEIDVTALPYREDVLAYLSEARTAGREVILATATHARYAKSIADHLGLFDGVLATEGAVNLKGSRKLDAIVRDMAARGADRFGYIGDGRADVAIWRESDEIVAVDPSAGVRRQLTRLGESTKILRSEGRSITSLLRAARPHQWVKNLLLFVPLALAHELGDGAKLGAAALGFVAFSLCASAVYLLNDMADVQADRHHPAKRKRPFAAGELSLGAGLIAAVALAAAAFGVAAALPARFVLMLVIYLGLTTAYSFGLKRVVALDVLTLAALYTQRLWAGGAAADVWISPWLIAFSLCVFLSLALMKRYTELLDLDPTDVTGRARGRGYIVGDARLIRLFGPVMGLLAAAVMMFYVTGEASRQYYQRPALLWLVGPLLAVWLGRMWWAAHRGRMHSDPVLFAVRDWPSYVIGLLIAAVGVLATIA